MAGSDHARTRELGVVAAGSPQSVAAGSEILRAGGNAADALVAAVFATAAGDPSITSLAGGAIAIFRDSNGTVEVGDFFSNAPGLEPAAKESGHPPVNQAASDNIDFRAVEIDLASGSLRSRSMSVVEPPRSRARFPG